MLGTGRDDLALNCDSTDLLHTEVVSTANLTCAPKRSWIRDAVSIGRLRSDGNLHQHGVNLGPVLFGGVKEHETTSLSSLVYFFT